jgi:hypothetical protein
MTQLENAYYQYRINRLSWERFIAIAVVFMNTVMFNRHKLTADERSEIISEFYPRIRGIVDNYREMGSSFEAYFACSLNHSCRTYISRKMRIRQHETVYLADGDPAETFNGLAAEPDLEPVYGELDPEFSRMQGPGQRDTLRRQLLVVLCQNIPVLSAGECERYALILDLPRSWLQAVLEYALHHRADRAERRTVLRERRDIHFAAMIRFERIAKDPTHTGDDAHHHVRYQFHRRLWLIYIMKLRNQTVHLSHREVSVLLGIPKGSVDSAVNILSRRLVTAAATG